jgi:hypothetical protein
MPFNVKVLGLYTSTAAYGTLTLVLGLFDSGGLGGSSGTWVPKPLESEAR